MNIHEAVERGEANRIRRAAESERSAYPEGKGQRYYCWICVRYHWEHSIIGQRHDPRKP
jgi:hypothetical protein